jgi:SAM-dependent methyltransferase
MGDVGRSAAWQERARSFGTVAAEYAVLRPTYPPDLVAFLVHGDARTGPGRRVLDLGAGTGRLTELLVADGHEVVAVDPSAAMVGQLAAGLPAVATAVGSAEALPLADASVDVVTAAQAAHWFDPAPTSAELRRVLRPGGAVSLLWNQRDDRVPWVGQLSALLAAENRERPSDRQVVAAFARELDAELAVAESVEVQSGTPEELVAGFATRSYAATMTEARRAEFLGEIRQLLAAHPDTRGRTVLELPHVTTAYRFTPR